jgi:predicted O-methyltransferase YrrM
MSKTLAHSISSYISYRLRSATKHGVHSPFVFDLVTKVLENNEKKEVFVKIHGIYREQCRSSRVLETTDFGVSSDGRAYSTKFLKVSEIARSSSVNRNTGELLFHLVEYFKPSRILELGTSLGMSTLYIATAAPSAKFITMEGCAAKVELAKSYFSRMEVLNLEVSTGRFDTQLPGVLEKLKQPDFVFMDGHHRYKPTMAYFKQILQYSHENTVIVLDDIHWSTGMELAWSEIQKMPEVTVTIDIYRLGIVFLKKSLSKQNFIIRF